MKKYLLITYLVLGNLSAVVKADIAEKNIHGKFIREQVQNENTFRNQVIGLIVDTKTQATCTGTLIGPKQVLTAAHCIYNFKTKEWSENFTFTPGKISKDDPGVGTFSSKKFFVQKEYIETMKEEFDFALIELDTPIGDTIGWVGFRALKPAEATDGTSIALTFTGYPGDKELGTLWSVSCPGEIKAELVTYLCDSFGGMSGSALFQAEDTQNFVIGVHTWGGPEKNGGVYFTAKNFEMINAWKNLTKYPRNTVVHSKGAITPMVSQLQINL